MTREQLYSGKAKTIYKTDNPDTLIAEFRNSLTAFNGEKKGEMEKKGYYNAQISKSSLRCSKQREFRPTL